MAQVQLEHNREQFSDHRGQTPMSLNRRQILFGFGAVAAPFVIRTSGLLMPINSLVVPSSAGVNYYLEGSNDFNEWVPLVRANSTKDLVYPDGRYKFRFPYINHRVVVQKNYLEPNNNTLARYTSERSLYNNLTQKQLSDRYNRMYNGDNSAWDKPRAFGYATGDLIMRVST